MSSKINYKKPPLGKKKAQKRNHSNKKDKSKGESQIKKETSSEKQLEKKIEKKEKEIEKEILEDEYAGLLVKNIEIEIDKKADNNINKNKKKSGDTKDFRTKWKTEICHYWEMNGYCKYGDNCAFAHGENELKNRKMSFNYKTKPCKQFLELGYCSYGSRCQFSHKKENEKNFSVSYLNILTNFVNKNNEKINENFLSKPRLVTFEILAHSNLKQMKENRIQLYEDFLNIKKENEIQLI